MAPLRALGWTDEALYFAITVCALFNFYNRWIDATGVHALSDEAHAKGQAQREDGLRPRLGLCLARWHVIRAKRRV